MSTSQVKHHSPERDARARERLGVFILKTMARAACALGQDSNVCKSSEADELLYFVKRRPIGVIGNGRDRVSTQTDFNELAAISRETYAP